MPCLRRGAQAALSPNFGAPATPGVWQAVHVVSNTFFPSGLDAAGAAAVVATTGAGVDGVGAAALAGLALVAGADAAAGTAGAAAGAAVPAGVAPPAGSTTTSPIGLIRAATSTSAGAETS